MKGRFGAPKRQQMLREIAHAEAKRGPSDGGAFVQGRLDSDTQAALENLGLTERQFMVLALVMEGKSNKAICRELDMSEQTVKKHVTAILKSLNVSNRTEAVIAVSRLGRKHLPVGDRDTGNQSDTGAKSHSALLSAMGDGRRLSLEPPDKPSIVVLPFANLSGDPSQEYFADGMVEDITMALGRLPWLFVIGSGSAFTYKNVMADPRKVGDDLGVRYILSGSVRKQQNRVRIGAQLADASHGGQIWADRFDGELDGIFEMQDRVAAYVSTKIAPALQSAEMTRSDRKPTENLTAYDLFLRASRYQRDSEEQNKSSLRQMYRAIDLDPSYGAAYGLAAFCHFWQKVFGWISPSAPAIGEGIRLARLAVEHGRNDSEALWMAAQAVGMLAGELEEAVELIDAATALNPNSPGAWWTGCLIRAFLGQIQPSLENAARAFRLDPLDPLASTHANATGLAHFFAGHYDEAARIAEQVLSKEPAFLPALRLKVAACGHLGHREESRAAVKRLLAMRPHATVKDVGDYYAAPLRRNPVGLKNLLEGLRLAGLAKG